LAKKALSAINVYPALLFMGLRLTGELNWELNSSGTQGYKPRSI
jgi:hypothetical protein